MQLKGRIGFANLPDQLVNKEIKKGFDFNIMCVGELSRYSDLTLADCISHVRCLLIQDLFFNHCRRNRHWEVHAD